MQKLTVCCVRLVEYVIKKGMLKLKSISIGLIHWCHNNPSKLHSQPLLCMDDVGIELLQASTKFSIFFSVCARLFFLGLVFL